MTSIRLKKKLHKRTLLPFVGFSFFLHFLLFFFFSTKNPLFFLKKLKIPSQDPIPVNLISRSLDQLPKKVKKQKIRKKTKAINLKKGFKTKSVGSNLNESKKAPVQTKTSNDTNRPISYENVKGLDKIALHEYLSHIENHIHQYWDLPSWLNDPSLKTHVIVFLDSKGLVLKKSLILSSNNSLFDLKVLEVIEKSSPFPPPSERLIQILSKGLVIRFPN